MRMPKRVEPAARNLERVQYRPESSLDNFIGAHWPPDLIREPQLHRIRFPCLKIVLQHSRQWLRHGQRSSAGLAFEGLKPAVPGGAEDKDQSPLEIKAVQLES